MLKIYHFDVSTMSNKVRFVANALEIEHELCPVNMMQGEHQSPEHKKLHPAGKIPVIDDNGFVLFESNAIIRYLATKAGNKFYSTVPEERAIIDQWIDFGTIHVGSAVGRVMFNRLMAPKFPQFEVDERSLQDGLNFLDRFLPIVDEQLSKNEYLAGSELTLADFVLLSFLDPAEVIEVDLSLYSNITVWRNNLKKQDFYTKVFKDYADNFQGAA